MSIKTVYVGYTTAPRLKRLNDGKIICEFSVMDSYTLRGEEITDFYNVTLWDSEQAVRFYRKMNRGCILHIEGKLRSRAYMGNDGNLKSSQSFNDPHIEVITWGNADDVTGKWEPFEARMQQMRKFGLNPVEAGDVEYQPPSPDDKEDDIPF